VVPRPRHARAEQLRLRPHDADELSHYSSGTSDVEFLFPWGWDELEGIANRGDYDLTQHQSTPARSLDYFDQAANERYLPHVIEPAAGATRTMLAFLIAAYDEEEVKGEKRTVLRLHHRLAPYKVAVLPLSKKPELTGPCLEMLATLQPQFMCDYDETQAIGKRYRRQDEIGTPYCVTFDFDSIEDRRSPCATATRWSRSASRSRASSYKLAFQEETEVDPEKSIVLRAVRKWFPPPTSSMARSSSPSRTASGSPRRSSRCW
jgi:glycyl-tRNA synthetase (class II)